MVRVRSSKLKLSNLEAAYESYYSRQLNSGRLSGYGKLLEELYRGRLLSPRLTQLLMKTLFATETGKDRLLSALPDAARFAHKTGTQRNRICDFGIVEYDPSVGTREPLVMVVCVKDLPKQSDGKELMRAVSRIISD